MATVGVSAANISVLQYSATQNTQNDKDGWKWTVLYKINPWQATNAAATET